MHSMSCQWKSRDCPLCRVWMCHTTRYAHFLSRWLSCGNWHTWLSMETHCLSNSSLRARRVSTHYSLSWKIVSLVFYLFTDMCVFSGYHSGCSAERSNWRARGQCSQVGTQRTREDDNSRTTGTLSVCEMWPTNVCLLSATECGWL